MSEVAPLLTAVCDSQLSKWVSVCSPALKRFARGNVLTNLTRTGGARDVRRYASCCSRLKSRVVRERSPPLSRHLVIRHSPPSSHAPWLPTLFLCSADVCVYTHTGEVVWGQLAAFVSGMKSGLRDEDNAIATPTTSPTSSSPSPWRFRAAARSGIWHVRTLSSFHSSCLTAVTATDRACERSSNTIFPLTFDRLFITPPGRRPHVHPHSRASQRRLCTLRGPYW